MEKSSTFVTRKIAGRTLLMPLAPPTDGLCLFELNAVAAFLWERLPAATEDSLVDAVTEAFDVSRDVAATDVAELVAELRRLGAIEPVDRCAP